MIMSVATTVLTAFTLATQTDTTFAVRPGARLDVNNFGGAIAVQVWNRNAVRVEAEHSPRVLVMIEQSGSNLEVRAESRRGVPGRVEYRITVPVWMALALSGVYTDVSVDGTKGDVSAETVKGDVSVRGGDGFIRLSSVQGLVTVAGSRGRLEASSVNQGVNVSDVEGEVSVDAVNGDVTLDRIDSPMVEAATVNGKVIFVGAVRDGGRYRFASHNGDLQVFVPESVNATVSVATFNGEFESDFPLRLLARKRLGKQFNLTLGSGSAQVDLETFQGTINLRRGLASFRRALMTKPKER